MCGRRSRELASILAFQKVCQLVPPDVPMILESSVDEAEINEKFGALSRR